MPSEYQKLQAEAKKLGIRANQSGDALREAIEAAKGQPADSPPSQQKVGSVSISLEPRPLRANEQLTITVSGLDPEKHVRLAVRPGVTRTATKTDRFGQIQTVFVPQEGKHTLAVETTDGKTIEHEFEVAEQTTHYR